MYGQEPSSSLLHFSDLNTFNFNSFNISLFLFLPVSLVSISQPPNFRQGSVGRKAGLGRGRGWGAPPPPSSEVRAASIGRGRGVAKFQANFCYGIIQVQMKGFAKSQDCIIMKVDFNNHSKFSTVLRTIRQCQFKSNLKCGDFMSETCFKNEYYNSF